MDIIGSKIVGYRYGEAPECGRSFNTQTRQYECGVSMAQVGYMEEVGSFAVSGAYGRKKYYYEVLSWVLVVTMKSASVM